MPSTAGVTALWIEVEFDQPVTATITTAPEPFRVLGAGGGLAGLSRVLSCEPLSPTRLRFQMDLADLSTFVHES